MSDCDDFDCTNCDHQHFFQDDSKLVEDLKITKLKTLSAKLSHLSTCAKHKVVNGDRSTQAQNYMSKNLLDFLEETK